MRHAYLLLLLLIVTLACGRLGQSESPGGSQEEAGTTTIEAGGPMTTAPSLPEVAPIQTPTFPTPNSAEGHIATPAIGVPGLGSGVISTPAIGAPVLPTPATGGETNEVEEEDENGEEAGQRPLADEWYIDSNGNGIPDFVELAMGYDPTVDNCAPAVCSLEGMDGASMITQEQNVLIILDASGSMAVRIGNQTMMEVAKEAIIDYVTVLGDVVNLGFMVYGHRGDNTPAGRTESCAAIELLKPLGELSSDNVGEVSDPLRPTGWTPIADSLEAGGELFADRLGADNKIILLTDGLETCDGDPVAVARRLHEDPTIQLVIDVIGFNIQSPTEVEQLKRIAEAGGGIYHDARNRADLRDYFGHAIAETAQRFNFTLCIAQNSINYGLCMGQMVTNATNRIRSTQLSYPGTDPAFMALQNIIGNILAAREESNQRYLQFREELNQLLLQRDELERRRQELFGEE